MIQKVAQLVMLIRDYDEAIGFYTGKLGFEILEDTRRSETKRWVRVAPPGSGCSSLFAKSSSAQQDACVGNQTGGRVFAFLNTDNFDAYYNKLKSNGVEFVGSPRNEGFGKVVVFMDLYGNKWDLIEPQKPYFNPASNSS
ncbi:MAG: VOC family protein [Phycisphaerales bacterium]|nr:VOC family protein [Phycisphaerales bacterium]